MKDHQGKTAEELTRLNRELSLLNALSQVLNESVDFDAILNNSLDKIVEIAGVPLTGIYVLDERSKELLFAAHRGFSEGFVRAVRRLKVGEAITGRVVQSGEGFFVDDYALSPYAIPMALEEGLRSLAVIPIKSAAKIYGTLNLAWKVPHPISPSEKSLFNSIGQIVGGAMERASYYGENLRRLEELKTLNAINQEIASRLELKVVLQKIVESAVGLLGAEAGVVALWDRRKQCYTGAVVHNLPESMIGREYDPAAGGIIGEVITRKIPVVHDAEEARSKALSDFGASSFQKAVGLPLIVRDMLIGAMVVGTSDPRKHFGREEIDLLFNFANQAAVAIGNTMLYEDSLAKIDQLTTLYEIGRTLSSTLDLDELLRKALEMIQVRFGYATCGILTLDKEKAELQVRQLIGEKIQGVTGRRFRLGVDGIVGWVAQAGEPYYAPDVSKEPRYLSVSPDTRSEAAFPLKVGDEIIGVLNIESNEIRGFGEEDLRILSLFANQVSIAMQNARLFSDLKETLQHLKEAQEQIVQAEKLRALGEMASGVAHDFNNLLAVILGNIQLLSHQLDSLSIQEIRERLKIVERASKDGAETVRRIQEFTGVRRDREYHVLSIHEIIRDVIAITQPRWKDQPQKRGIQIDIVTDLQEVPPILGNGSEIREVLTNIVFNAVDAMPQGGKLTLSTSSYPEWVEVRVSDTGIGMSEEVKRRIFDPFFTTKGPASSGLGMSVSYGIVRRHGGEILVESEPGKGTTFLVRFPVGYEKEEKKEPETVAESKGVRARILVIDDEPFVRDILSKMFGLKGHEVVVASDGEEGIERFKSEPFDLVFTDLGMPKLSGWEVGKTIKELRPQTPVIMITGWGTELDPGKLRANGIDRVVTKPFNFEELHQVVLQAMETEDNQPNASQ